MKFEQAVAHFDLLIIGAGISGIGMAVHFTQKCPGKTFTMLDRNEGLGGTWRLFQYPGIRSDSDMHTLGFEFEPWTDEDFIADGPAIMKYLNKITNDYGLEDHMRFNHKVLTASWSSKDAKWFVTAQTPDGVTMYSANFLYTGAGYYDYDEGYDPVFEGREKFEGDIIHPQFWPKDYDYSGKKVVVIGSGATAVTIVPSMVDKAKHVTMLQRTPTWYWVRARADGFANFLRKIMPETWAYAITRFKNIRMQSFFFKQSRKKPEKIGQRLLDLVKQEMGEEPNPKDFKPPYNPWDQRLCLVPDGDMFKAFKAGKASLVTDHIDRFTEKGIALKSGKHLDADLIITATGLKLAMAGKVKFDRDGQPLDFSNHFYYKGAMFSNVPNMAIVFGYINASWTLKVDIVANYVCRIINKMDEKGKEIAWPLLDKNTQLTEDTLFEFSSGYLNRSMDILPKIAKDMPWRITQDYLFERKVLRDEPVDDGVMKFYNSSEAPDMTVFPAEEMEQSDKKEPALG